MKDTLLSTDSDPSDSSVQREIESQMLQRLEEMHPDWRRISWKTFATEKELANEWVKAEPDAIWKTNSKQLVLAECYSRVGDLKTGHRRKLAMDTLKLLALRDAVKGYSIRCILVVPDELKNQLTGNGWFPVAIQNVAEIVSVNLSESEKMKLNDASRLQAQGQAHTKRISKDRAK
jgi:hypothetical protein